MAKTKASKSKTSTKTREKLTQIGLERTDSRKLGEKLNELLANYQIFYINSRGFHWNIKGENFFELHVKFEELYTDSLAKIDEIAERILTLGFTPLHSFTDYLGHAKIKEATGVSKDREAVQLVVEGFRQILDIEREVLEAADKISDEGTSDLMGGYIREQEKLVWMYNSFLG